MKTNPTKLISLKYDDVYREVFAHENVRKQFLSDVLGIPLESIRTVRLVTPHLWKRYHRQKLGILDMALELNDDTKVNVELQVRRQKHWVKRELFYLARMYEEDLRVGQDYSRLKKCISIGILDFRLLEGESYHSVYRLRDETGVELTEQWEIHIIELRKNLHGDRLDGWIRLFNAESKEELDMLAAKNKGLAEAAEVIKRMSLGKALRYRYEAYLKAKRDRYGEDEYIKDLAREEGLAEGKAQGKAQGMAQGMAEGMAQGMAQGMAEGKAQGIAEGKAQGIVEGKAEAVMQLLGELGEIPDALKERIRKETDLQVLGKWLKIAARAESISEFEKKMED